MAAAETGDSASLDASPPYADVLRLAFPTVAKLASMSALV